MRRLVQYAGVEHEAVPGRHEVEFAADGQQVGHVAVVHRLEAEAVHGRACCDSINCFRVCSVRKGLFWLRSKAG